MADTDRVAMGLVGGLILGVWVYGLLFKFSQDWQALAWFGWGAVGLVIAGAVYAARSTHETMRVLLVSAIGILTTVVVIYAISEFDVHAWASLTTFIGAGLIASTLPSPASESDKKAS